MTVSALFEGAQAFVNARVRSLPTAHTFRLLPAWARAFCAPRVRIARIRVLRCSADRAHSDHLAARPLGAIHQQPPSRGKAAARFEVGCLQTRTAHAGGSPGSGGSRSAGG